MNQYRVAETNVDEYILNEYGELWTYYRHIMEEQKNSIDRYIRLVGIPTLLAAYLGLSPSTPEHVNAFTLGILLLPIVCVGFSIYASYALEARNSDLYVEAINAIRSCVKLSAVEPRSTPDENLDSPLDKILIIQKLRKGTEPVTPKKELLKVKFWRGLPIAIINSSVFGVSCTLICHACLEDLAAYVGAFAGVVSLVSHVVFYGAMFKNYKNAGAQEADSNTANGTSTDSPS